MKVLTKVLWPILNVIFLFRNVQMQNCFRPDYSLGTCTSVIRCSELVNDYVKQIQDAPGSISFSDYISSSLCGFDGYDFLVCCASAFVTTPRPTSSILRPESSFLQFISLNYNPLFPTVAPITIAPTPSKGNYVLPRNPADRCGISNVSQTRVVGGVEAKRGAYPWVAALGYVNANGNSPSFYCGGSLITSRHVLTTAHCVTSGLYMVRLGAHDLTINQPGVLDVALEKRIVHPEYDSTTILNDVALLKLLSDVQTTGFIRPICLPVTEPWRSKNLTGLNAFVSGWGAVSFQGPVSNVLRDTQLPIVDTRTCEQNYRVRFPTVSLDQRVICAGRVAGDRDACQGDSGGPLMLAEISPDRSYYFFYLVGIVSYGYECAKPGYPGIYTRVSVFIPWIESRLNE